MNERLERKLKAMYRIQREIDELINEKNKLKNELEDEIMNARMENRKFLIGDRSISYVKRTITQPLTNKFMDEVLKNYYKNDSRAGEVYQYIMNRRKKTTKYQLEINKKPNKNKKNNRKNNDDE